MRLLPVLPLSRVVALLMGVIGACHLPATGADYPDRPIRYIVPSATGNGADISARILIS